MIIQKTKELVKLLYRNDKGEPFILTEGQTEIFDAIFRKKNPRVHIEAATRYGKSETISMAVLTRVSTFPEKWAIVAGNQDKAGIIMSDIIKHIFDNEYTRRRFVIEKGETEERIRRFRNKSKINFKLENNLLGEVFITTAEGALGFGAACFPEYIKIKTDKGQIEIGEIVDKKLDVKILTYNHQKKKTEYKEISGYNKRKDKLLEIDFGRKKLVCTEEHPIWVEGKGYIKAKDIKQNDIVLALD